MSNAWTCSHQLGDTCVLLNKPCNPGEKGCTLFGKAVFADASTPSNAAVERREKKRIFEAKEAELNARKF
jgi:hypothetical protein